MLKHRLIPTLLLSNGGLVKTTKFKDPKYVGDPLNAIRIFNEKEVDELLLLDINATKDGKDPNYSLIEEIAGECFMPLCYGGGVKSLDQASRIFNLGVEKICLQTAAIIKPELITEIANRYGSQAVVISLDIKKNIFGKYEIHNKIYNNLKKFNWKTFLDLAVSMGAGEVLINSVDKDGTRSGPDLELIKQANINLDVPLIALGGVGKLLDIKLAIDAGANAVAAGSFFVFNGRHKAVLITYPRYQDLKNLFE